MTTLTLVQAKNGIIVLPNAGDMFHSLDSALVFTSVDDFATYLRAALNQTASAPTIAAPAQTMRDQLSAIAADLEKIADVKYAGRNAIVCLVGENIRETPQIAARVFTALGEINVRMISQGASEINITFVIDEDDVPEAIRRLHRAFFTEVDPEVFD